MNAEERIDKAIELHHKGYNCAQSVAMSLKDLVDIDENSLFGVMEGFGLGMGNMQSVCGAISGAVGIASLLNSSNNVNNSTTKGNTYKVTKQIVSEFYKKNKTIICGELKGLKPITGQKSTNGVVRPCDGCIEDAVRIFCDITKK